MNLQNGTRSAAAAAGTNSNFTAELTASELAAFNAAWPNRLATKHAHSQQNPEKDWGKNTLDAVRFAFYVLNEERAARNSDGTAKIDFKPANTIVIASSVSNGGGAAIAAAEQDTDGLIDGVAVAEPTLELTPPAGLTVVARHAPCSRSRVRSSTTSRSATCYMGCASQSPRAANSYGVAAVLPVAGVRHQPLRGAQGEGLPDRRRRPQAQADEALDKLLAAGYQPESIPLLRDALHEHVHRRSW